MGKSKSTPKMHHILILSSSLVHFSPLPLLIAAVEEVLEREKGALERERDVSGRSSNRRGGMAFGVGGGARSP